LSVVRCQLAVSGQLSKTAGYEVVLLTADSRQLTTDNGQL